MLETLPAVLFSVAGLVAGGFILWLGMRLDLEKRKNWILRQTLQIHSEVEEEQVVSVVGSSTTRSVRRQPAPSNNGRPPSGDQTEKGDTVTTRYGIPCIKLPHGGYIQPGRILRFLVGIGVIVALLAGWIEAHDKIELGMWIGLALLLIDPRLVTTAVTAFRTAKHGAKGGP